MCLDTPNFQGLLASMCLKQICISPTGWSKHVLRVRHALKSPLARLISEVVTGVTSPVLVPYHLSFLLLHPSQLQGGIQGWLFSCISIHPVPHHNIHDSWSRSWPLVNTVS